MPKIHSDIVCLRSGVTRFLSAKSFELTKILEKDLANWKTVSSSLRNPLRFLAQSLANI